MAQMVHKLLKSLRTAPIIFNANMSFDIILIFLEISNMGAVGQHESCQVNSLHMPT